MKAPNRRGTTAVLITGAAGFAGSHLAEECARRGWEVHGTARSGEGTENLAAVPVAVIHRCELSDADAVRTLVEEVQPAQVYHLAAQASVQRAWQDPMATLTNNIAAQLAILRAVQVTCPQARVLVVSSSEVYGRIDPARLPVKEDAPLGPLDPYAVSKVTQDMMAFQYFRSYGLPIIRTRAFNHEGPRRGDVFVTSNFARQVAEIEAGLREPIVYVGDLTPRRDYSDVRDIVRGYWLLLERGEPGEVYNLCSGKSWQIQQVLDFLLGLSTVKGITVKTDPARLRPSDVMILEGSPAKIHKATGWKVEIPFERTLTELVDYWRQRIRASTR